jgi:hypothetical protein
MNRLRTAALAVVTTAALGTVATPVAAHATGAPAPCAQQQTQVDAATAALARVTAVFNREKHQVAADRVAAAHARTPNAKAAARAQLAVAQHKLARTAKAKKAQQQRLAHAEARLAACQAAQPTATPSA